MAEAAALTALEARLKAAAHAHMQGGQAADPAHDIAHLSRVAANARALAGAEAAAGRPTGSLRVLLAAAWLHDLVNLPKDHPERAHAALLSARAAAPILTRAGLSPPEVAAACHAIRAHSHSAGLNPETPEARLLQDADRLDALGAIGISRTLAVSGALGRALFHPDDPFARHRAPDDARHALDHWPRKLLRLPATMQTAAGRATARARLAIMRDFLHALAGELGHAPPDHWFATPPEQEAP